MHAQLFQQLPLATNAVQVAQQQDPQQHFWVNRRSACLAIGIAQLVTHKLETDVAINEAQKMVLRNLIFDAEIVEQRLRAGSDVPS